MHSAKVQDLALVLLRKLIQKRSEDGIRPPKTRFIGSVPVAENVAHFGALADYIVFLIERPISKVFVLDKRQKLSGNPVRLLVVPVTPQSLDDNPLQRSPADRRVPLISAAKRAGRQAPRTLEEGEVTNQ